MNSLGYDQVAALYAGTNTSTDRAFRKWEPTIYSLLSYSAQPVLINEGTQYDENGWFDSGLALDGNNRQNELVKPDVIRDYTGRFPGHKTLRSLNERAVLDIVTHKAATYALFDEASRGVFIQLDLIDHSDIGEALHSIPGQKVVLKPDKGLSSEGVVILSKHQAQADSAQYRGKGYILQQHMPGELGDEIMGLIRGIDESEQSRVKLDAEHELRFFMTGLDDQNMVPVLRQTEQTAKDKIISYYIYLDPDTVPQTVFEFGKKVMSTIKVASNTDEIFLAVDCIFNEQTGSLALREANGKEPGMPKMEDQQTISWS
jgi:hypothetical protein